jgi:hypothetical protein
VVERQTPDRTTNVFGQRLSVETRPQSLPPPTNINGAVRQSPRQYRAAGGLVCRQRWVRSLHRLDESAERGQRRSTATWAARATSGLVT